MDIRLVCLNCDRAIEIPSEGEEHFCPLCGVAVRVELPPEPEVPGLATAFLYPFNSVGSVLFLLVMAPLWSFFRSGWSAVFGFVGYLFIGGYIATWLWSILAATAMGKHRAPGAPLPADLGELVGAFFRFVGALVVAFAPAAVAALVFNGFDVPRAGWHGAVTGALAVAGVLYYPMALLLVGFAERWSASLHAVFAVRSILILRGDYLLCCAFFLVTFGVSSGLEAGLAALPYRLRYDLQVLAYTGATLIQLALYAVQMRAVGLVYLANRKRLGWFY